MTIDTPIGRLRLAASDDGLTSITLANDAERPQKTVGASAAAHLNAAAAALERYFSGSREDFADVRLAMAGTPFQRSVWQALREIPYSSTISYSELARRIGRANAVRAVGLANGQNPIPIVVPCHRVIGANGALTGFGLGIAVKAWLLTHEGAASFPAAVTATTRVSPGGQRSLLP